MNNQTDVPTFKLARVGKERKKRGGALSWLRGGSGTGNGSWAGAVGGAGGGGGAVGFLAGAGKILTIIAVTALIGAGAIEYSKRQIAAEKAAMKNKPAADKTFAKKAEEPIKYEGDLSNLPATKNTIPNSMGYVTGNAGGPSAAEMAAKAAAEEAAAKQAEEEAARKKAEEEALAAAQPQGDPNAAAGAPGNRLGSKFGQLSSSFGGKGSALAGGSGMSGGMNRNFGAGGNLGGGMKAGATGGYNMGSRASYGKGARAAIGNSSGKSLSRRQLARVNTFSRLANSQTGENASSLASAGWDNNSGEGNVITGAGVGNGQGPSATNPDSVDEGGPTGGGGGGGSGTTTAAPPKESEGDKSAWMLEVAKALLLVVAVVAVLIAIFRYFEWFPAITAAVNALRIAAIAMGAIIAGLGVAYMATTQDTGGGGALCAVTGAAIATLAYLNPELMANSTGLVVFAGAGLLGQLAKNSDASAATAGQQ